MEFLKSYPLVILENLREIFSRDDKAAVSDGEYVIEKMSATGFKVVTYVLADASKMGSLTKRVRVYYICLRIFIKSATFAVADKLKVFTEDLFHSFEAPRPMTTFFLLDNATQDDGTESDEENPSKVRKLPTTLLYKMEHLDVYKYFGLAWHPQVSEKIVSVGCCAMYTSGMTLRCREVAYILQCAYDDTTNFPHNSFWYVDGNTGLKLELE